jgi:hypothetical protein
LTRTEDSELETLPNVRGTADEIVHMPLHNTEKQKNVEPVTKYLAETEPANPSTGHILGTHMVKIFFTFI